MENNYTNNWLKFTASRRLSIGDRVLGKHPQVSTLND